MKKIALVLLLSMLMPPVVPMQSFSSVAYADDSSPSMPGASKDKNTQAAIPTAIATTNQLVAQDVIANKNALASIMGTAKPEATSPAAASAFDNSDAVGEKTPLTEEARKKTVLEEMPQEVREAIIKFTNIHYNILAKKLAQEKIAKKLKLLTETMLTTGGTILSSVNANANLEIMVTYKNKLTITVTLVVDPTVGKNPKPEDIKTNLDWYHPIRALIDAMRLITDIMNGVNNSTG